MPQPQSLRERLRHLRGRARKRELQSYLLHALASLAELEEELLREDDYFVDLSIDSLRAVEFKQQLERDLGLKLRSTLLFDHPTLRALCEHLLLQLGDSVPSDPQPDYAVATASAECNGTDDDAIAVVGYACRLPGGVNTPEAYWRMLQEGRDAVEMLDAHSLGPREAVAASLDDFPPFGGLIADIDGFDARLFAISPKEALEMDPQQRILLHVCWEALERAGIPVDTALGHDTAMFVGTRGSEYHEGYRRGGEPAYQGTGAATAALAGRVAHCFGVSGVALTVDTACSASLVALHYAVEELRRGDCSRAIAAGVNLLLSPFASRATHAAQMLAPDGRCKAFSERANGYVRSEACVALVLRRLRDAQADGDAVLGLVCGSAVNHDGATSGLTVPSGAAQQAVIRRALKRAGLTGSEISYVECHGTGTELGDPIEVQALSAALEVPNRAEPLAIGSVKSQIGHTEPAAGLAGVLKVLLAMQHRTLPRTLHCDTGLNPHVDFQALGLRPILAVTPWRATGSRLYAGVSSFGFTGTNAHVLLASPPVPATTQANSTPWPLLTLSAKTPEALQALIRRWANWLAGRSTSDIDAACRISNVSRSRLPYRRCWDGAISERLSELLTGSEARPSRRAASEPTPTAIALLGDASDWQLFEDTFVGTWPAFQRALDTRLAAIETVTGFQLRGGPSTPLHAEMRALAAACATGDALLALGVEPELWLGQGIGLAAAHALAGTPLERVIPVLAVGSALDKLDGSGTVRPLGVETGQLLLERGLAQVIAVAPAIDTLLPDALWLVPEHKTLRELTAGLYESGVNVDWPSVRFSAPPTALDLPTYPFELQRYWRPFDLAGSVLLRARSDGLLGAELHSPALQPGARAFRVELDHQRHPWLLDHQVEGMPVVPAAGILDILRETAQRLLERGQVAVKELQLEEPLIVREDAYDIQVVAFPEVDGFSVELSCAQAKAPERFVRHARARLCADNSSAPTDMIGGGSSGGIEVRPDELYAILQQIGIQHGSRFRALSRITHDGDAADVEVDVPPGPQAALGAAGLDACFLASAALLVARGDVSPRLPSACDEVTFFAAPNRNARATVRLQPIDDTREVRVDLDIRDTAHNPIASVRGLHLRARERGMTKVRRAGVAALPFTWVERSLQLAPRGDTTPVFEVIADDLHFAERLCSVLRKVHRTRATARSLSEPVVASADVHNSGPPRQVILVNRELSGPRFLSDALHHVRALVRARQDVQLWLVTRGVHSTAVSEPQAFKALSRAAVWGFGRSVQQELPRLACTLVDLGADLTAEAECELLAAEFRRNAEDAQVRYVDGVRQVPAIGIGAALHPMATGAPSLHADASYLVTGGAGALGRLAVEQLAAAGAGHVIIASRRPSDLEVFVQSIAMGGTKVSVWELDVADAGSLRARLDQLNASGFPLRGVLHLAGTLADSTIEQLDAPRLQEVFAPKIQGGWHLHELTAGLELDFFITYSSLAAALGSAGQANYAGANAFLDVLVEARNRAGLVGASLQWGPWAEVGMAAEQDASGDRLTRLGIAPLPTAGALAFLNAALNGIRGVSVIADVEWSTYAAAMIDERLCLVLPVAMSKRSAACPGELGTELRALADAQPEQVACRLDAYLQERIMDVAGSRVISDHDSFFELGLDSLQAVSMRTRIESDLGIQLSATLIFDYPTLAELRKHLLHDHLGVLLHDVATEHASALLPTSTHEGGWPAPKHSDDDARLLAELEVGLNSLERELEA